MLKSQNIGQHMGTMLLYVIAKIKTPAIAIFLSANLVNAGNLLYNLLFTRLMGPEIFGELVFYITIMLSFLALLNAVQMQVTEIFASAQKCEKLALLKSYRRINRQFIIASILGIGLLLAAMILLNRFSQFSLYFIIAFALPASLPLIIWRGIQQAEINLRALILSANAEMLSRLVLGWLLWSMGWGLEGVIFAFVLSVFIGALCAFSTRFYKIPSAITPAKREKILPKHSLWSWTILQFAVILLLDGDIFISNFFMTAENSGYIGTLSLVQRLFFFASFSLSTLLLPQVIQAVQKGETGWEAMRWVLGIFFAVSAFGLLILGSFPELITQILFGSAFAKIAPEIFLAGLNAALVTYSYLLISFRLAQKKRQYAWILWGFSLMQLAILSMAMQGFFVNFGILHNVLLTKFACQLSLAMGLTLWVLIERTSINPMKFSVKLQKRKND